MINKLFTVAKNTFTETLRQPVYSVILAFALFLFILSPSITMYSLDEDIKLLREIGLSTLFITDSTSCMLCVLLRCLTFQRDICHIR